jgi:hypothetical protein
MQVTIYKVTESWNRRVGRLLLQDDRVVAEPADDPMLQSLLSEPLECVDGERHWKVDPQKEPEEFLRQLLWVFRGSCSRGIIASGPVEIGPLSDEDIKSLDKYIYGIEDEVE